MKLICALWAAALLMSLAAMAQPGGANPGPGGDDAPPARDDAAEDGADKESGADGGKVGGEDAGEDAGGGDDNVLALLEGDMVELVSGRKLEGVQVIRKTAKGYEVQTLPDLPPLLIPLKQVANVVYDEVDPRRPGAEAAPAPEAATPGMFNAQELSPEMHDKITAPLSQTPLAFADTDFIAVLDQTIVKAGVPLEIDPAVRQLPEGQRAWTVTITPGMNSYTLLKEELLGAFDTIEVVNQEDRVLLRLKPEAAPGPPGAPAPAPLPGAAPPTAP